MVKNNILRLLHILIFLQIINLIESKKCFVKYPKNYNISDNVEKPSSDIFSSVEVEPENETANVFEDYSKKENAVISDNENDEINESLDSGKESDVEKENGELNTKETTSTSIPVATETVKPLTTVSTKTETTTTKAIKTEVSSTTTIVRTTTIGTEPTSTNSPNSCIKDSEVFCGSRNTVCSLGMDELPAEISTTELLKITSDSYISEIATSLNEKYNKDIIFSCVLSNFVQGVKDYRYRSNERDDDFMKSFKETEIVVHLFGDISCHPKRLQEVNESDPDYEKNKSSYVKNDEDEYDNNLYWILDDESTSILFKSKISLESSEPLKITYSLSDGSTKDYEYMPLTDIRVSATYSSIDGIKIKDGYYVVYNDMYNFSSYQSHWVSLSGTLEKWKLNVRIDDKITNNC